MAIQRPDISTKELVKIVVRTNPNPNDRIAGAVPDGAVLFIDPDRPNMLITAQFFEPQRGMIGILGKQRIRATRCVPMGFAQPRIRSPETRSGA